MASFLSAQSMFSIKGRVLDAKNKLPVAYANVVVLHTFLGTSTDEDGYFKLRLKKGSYSLLISHIAYDEKLIDISAFTKDTVITVKLNEHSARLGVVTVNGKRETPPSVFIMSGASMKNIPAMGEPDVLRAVAFLPGVFQKSDYNLGLNFRGGNVDQNQIFWDGVGLFNPYHLLGIFSSFNLWALKSATVYTAHFPAKYNGGLSGIVDIKSKGPGTKDFTKANISLLSSNFSVARAWGNTFILAAARRTYLDLVLRLFSKTKFLYNFYDLNLNINQKISNELNVDFIGFLNKDAFSIDKSSNVWGNRLFALRFNFDNQHFQLSQTSLFNTLLNDSSAKIVDNNQDQYEVKYYAQLFNNAFVFNYGLGYKSNSFAYQWDYTGIDNKPLNVPTHLKKGNHAGLFQGWASGKFFLNKNMPVTINMRFLSDGQKKFYFVPGAYMEWYFSNNINFSAGYDRSIQFLGAGRDALDFKQTPPLFILDKTMKGDQYTVGTKFKLPWNINFSGELFYRQIKDIPKLTDDFDSYPTFVIGGGQAYGFDAMIERTEGHLTFQLNYSFLQKKINYPETVHPDEPLAPHVFKGIIGVHLGHSWELNLSTIYRSGAPYKNALGYFPAAGSYYDDRIARNFDPAQLDSYFILSNNYVYYKPYLRFDVSLRKRYKNKYFNWTLYIQAQNITFHSNPIKINSKQYNHQLYINGAADDFSYLPGIPILPSVGIELAF